MTEDERELLVTLARIALRELSETDNDYWRVMAALDCMGVKAHFDE